MNANSTLSAVVEGSGTGVVAHVGLHALGAFADRLGLGDSFSARIPITGERLPLHDRGKVLTQAMLMFAGGGEACSDIEALRAQEALFGSVPSDSTLYRTIRSIGPTTLGTLWDAMAEVRAKVWRRAAATTGTATVVLDIDSSLHQIHSENKVDAAANYKGGYGFHPIYCFADATGETLAVRLRPGNAGANNIGDHIAVLDAAIAGLPAEIAVGHGVGDDPALVGRAVQVRTDSAGCTDFVFHARARNVGFAVVARSNAAIHAAISRVRFDEDSWQPALRQDGDERPGAAVAELTELIDLSAWPSGTRLIVRREPLHPGAQQSLFPSTMFRYWGHYTDAAGDPVALDVHMRAHAHVEDNIRRLKDSGASRFPFVDIDANRTWLAVVCFADGL
ncbi:MAG: IS1380 family transposase, partial [Actinobacteria bacterium]|nr:IS1380 family transposase [Actinomycetota bacterium]